MRPFAVVALCLAVAGCSLQKLAVDRLGDALAASGATFSSDDDPQLVREALPFTLKLIESLLAEDPTHEGLLLAAARGFTQYAFAFVQQDADRMEEGDWEAAQRERVRARKLFLRARDYGLRSLDAVHPGMAAALRTDPAAAVARAAASDVPSLYWTAAAWGSAIALGKDDPELVADLPAVEALIDRAAVLDESWGDGAIHALLIAYELARPGGGERRFERAAAHFERAVALTGGGLASPFVSYAENVAVAKQDLALFRSTLERALAVDPGVRPEWRLENLVMQERARWLLGREGSLFLIDDEAPEGAARHVVPAISMTECLALR